MLVYNIIINLNQINILKRYSATTKTKTLVLFNCQPEHKPSHPNQAHCHLDTTNISLFWIQMH